MTLSIDARVLPAGLAGDAISVTAVPSVNGRPFTEFPGKEPFPVAVYFLDADQSTAAARFGTTMGGFAMVGYAMVPTIPVPFTPEQPVERNVSVVVALTQAASLAGTYVVDVQLRAVVVYPTSIAPCVPSWEGKLALVDQSPVTGSAAEVARTALEPGVATGRYVARHIAVSAARAPSEGTIALLRVTLPRPTGPPGSRPWMGWARLIADNAPAPLVDGPIGQWDHTADNTLDAPILAGCDPGVPCVRGYWLVMSWMPTWAPSSGHPFATEPPGSMSWTGEVITLGPDASLTDVTVVDDTMVDPFAGLVTIGSPVIPFESPSPSVQLDITIMAQQVAPVAGLNRSLLATVVLTVRRHTGVATVVGDGAPPKALAGVQAWEGGGDFIVHPLDGCAGMATGTDCLRTFGLLAQAASLEWAFEMFGAPPGTTYRVSPPRVASPSQTPLVPYQTTSPGNSLLDVFQPLATAGVVAAAIVILVDLVQKRRRARAIASRPIAPDDHDWWQ